MTDITPDRVQPTPNAIRVVLSEQCTIQSAASLRMHLIEQITGPGPILIDGSRVERIDAAGLQLILSFALDCLEEGREFSWCNQSAPLSAAIELAGIGSMIDSPGVAYKATEH